MTENINKDSVAKTKFKNELFNHLRNHKKFFEDIYFYIEIIDSYIDGYANGLLNTPSNYSDYEYVQNDALKAYELYTVYKGTGLDKYATMLRSLWIDLHSLAKNTLHDIPPKKGRGRPKTTALRNALIAKIYKLYDHKERGLKSENSHFEKTVGIVLNFVEGGVPQDLHSLIMRALKVTEIN